MLESATFWVLISFIVFTVLVGRRGFNAIVGMLDKRSAQIKADLENAQKLREDAQALLAQRQREQEAAVKEAADIIAYGREEADRIREQAAADIQATIKRRETQAIDRIAQVEALAVAQVRAHVVDVAVGATRVLLAEQNRTGGPDPMVDDTVRALARTSPGGGTIH